MSPVRRFAVGMTAAAVAILATAAPASAHDELILSDPAAHAQLEAPPEQVTLTFSGQLLSLGDSLTGALIVVVDDTGRDWVSGEVEVHGETATAPLGAQMPVAGYQVRWQVISEDGHPISGIIPFTIGDAEPLRTATPTPSAEPPARSETPAAADTAGIDARPLIVGALGAGIAGAAFALFTARRRRSAPPSLQNADPTSHEL